MRGWPASALRAWARQVQWRHKLGKGGTPAKPLKDAIIAVSEYNPVWEKVSSADVWQAMRDTWVRYGPQNAPVFPEHCLVAKKRTNSLWDVLRSVNRKLLHSEVEETHIEEMEGTLSSLTLDVASD